MPRQSLKPKIEEALRVQKNLVSTETQVEEKKVRQQDNLSTIKSQQNYSKQVFEDFATFTVKNNKAMIIIYICSAIILLCSVAMFVMGDIPSGIIYTLLGLFFAFYGQFIRFIMRTQNKKNYNSTDYYEFTEDALKVVCKDAKGVEGSTYTSLYSKLYAVKRFKNYGYIYLNKAVAYIVSQENFKDVIEFNYVLNKIENAINQEQIKEQINKI